MTIIDTTPSQTIVPSRHIVYGTNVPYGVLATQSLFFGEALLANIPLIYKIKSDHLSEMPMLYSLDLKFLVYKILSHTVFQRQNWRPLHQNASKN